MTQKDYIATAALLVDRAESLDQTAWLDERQSREIQRHYAIGLADMFAADNSRFKRDKFYRACGLPELADN